MHPSASGRYRLAGSGEALGRIPARGSRAGGTGERPGGTGSRRRRGFTCGTGMAGGEKANLQGGVGKRGVAPPPERQRNLPGAPWLGGRDPEADTPTAAAPAGTGEPPRCARPAAPSSLGGGQGRSGGTPPAAALPGGCPSARQRRVPPPGSARSRRGRFPASAMGMSVIKRGGAGPGATDGGAHLSQRGLWGPQPIARGQRCPPRPAPPPLQGGRRRLAAGGAVLPARGERRAPAPALRSWRRARLPGSPGTGPAAAEVAEPRRRLTYRS